MRDIITPAVAMLVGVASGIYIFQPIILEQLKKDNNLNPKYNADEQRIEETFGDLTQPKHPRDPNPSQNGDNSKPQA